MRFYFILCLSSVLSDDDDCFWCVCALMSCICYALIGSGSFFFSLYLPLLVLKIITISFPLMTEYQNIQTSSHVYGSSSIFMEAPHSSSSPSSDYLFNWCNTLHHLGKSVAGGSPSGREEEEAGKEHSFWERIFFSIFSLMLSCLFFFSHRHQHHHDDHPPTVRQEEGKLKGAGDGSEEKRKKRTKWNAMIILLLFLFLQPSHITHIKPSHHHVFLFFDIISCCTPLMMHRVFSAIFLVPSSSFSLSSFLSLSSSSLFSIPIIIVTHLSCSHPDLTRERNSQK